MKMLYCIYRCHITTERKKWRAGFFVRRGRGRLQKNDLQDSPCDLLRGVGKNARNITNLPFHCDLGNVINVKK